MKYIAPEFDRDFFTCPNCGALSQQHSSKLYTYQDYQYGSGDPADNFHYANYGSTYCYACQQMAIWKQINEVEQVVSNKTKTIYTYKLIFPQHADVLAPHEEMPKEILDIYNEAALIYAISPKGSAGLLRLALQKLMPILGEKGEDINKDIKHLVEKGLPIKIQQAADALRVIGNQAVHPGQIKFDDGNDTASKLFELLNFIIDRMIAEPRKIQEIYEVIPEEKRKQIEERDNKKEGDKDGEM